MEDSIETMLGVGPVGGILEETISWQELSQVEKQYHKCVQTKQFCRIVTNFADEIRQLST